MPRRYVSPRSPVTVTLDGRSLVAERGEPLAVSLVGANCLALARSPKFHRPRGVACLRGGCDGCLARVDGVPNIMTCRTPAREGRDVVTQNSLGSREVDLLRMTDWFFPQGLNHHELFAGVPLAQQVMQAFAERVTGLGRLPDTVSAPRPASRREVPVLVVGSGASGMAVASALADLGHVVEVIDDALEAGGTTLAYADAERAMWAPLIERFEQHIAAGKVSVRLETPAIGIYGDDVLVASPTGMEVVHATTLVLATGAHDGGPVFSGNDLPGIVSARAAGWLLRKGVLIGDNVLVAVVEGGTGVGESFARAAAAIEGTRVTVAHGVPIRARGASSVRDATIRTAPGDVEMSIDALVIDAKRSPAYELCVQAGAKVRHVEHGFVVETDGGRVRDSVWAVGEVVGTELTSEAIEAESRRVATAIGRVA